MANSERDTGVNTLIKLGEAGNKDIARKLLDQVLTDLPEEEKVELIGNLRGQFTDPNRSVRERYDTVLGMEVWKSILDAYETENGLKAVLPSTGEIQ